jgi:hypothetical protein
MTASSAVALPLSPQPSPVRLDGQPRQRFTADTGWAAASAPAASSARWDRARSPTHPDNDRGTSPGRRRRAARPPVPDRLRRASDDARPRRYRSCRPPRATLDRAPPPRRRSKAARRSRRDAVRSRRAHRTHGWQPQRCAKMAGNAAPARHAPRRSVRDQPRIGSAQAVSRHSAASASSASSSVESMALATTPDNSRTRFSIESAMSW